MEITKTFANTFGDMMRAKLRWFVRRSLYRYAIAVVLITYGLHGSNPNLTTTDKLARGLAYFVAICLAVLLLHVVMALSQSRKITPRTITFTEQSLVVNHKGETATRGWNWISSAGESPTLISLLVQKMPRLELYLPKAKLTENEYTVLRGWLSSHGKLPPRVNVAEQRDERKPE